MSIEDYVDELWRKETDIYLPRLVSAITISAELHDSISKYWPGYFFSTPNPSAGVSIAIKLSVYANSIFSTALTVSRETENQWRNGLFVLVPICTRFVLESWGAIHFSRQILERFVKDSNVEREENQVNRLLFGSRVDKGSKVQLPFISGETNVHQSRNVMDFIEALSELGEKPKEAYNFLSEACHPNFIQSSYFQLAGPPLSNWQNESYKRHGHQILEQTVEIMELVMPGMQEDILQILEVSTKYIEGSIGKNKN